MKRMLLVVTLLWSTTSTAHPLHASAVRIDLHDDVVTLQLVMPLTQLQLSLPVTLDAAVLARDGDRLAAYVLQSTSLTAPGGRPFTIAVDRKRLRLDRVDDADQVLVDVVATPPAGASTRAFTLRETAIVDRVDNHRIYVELRNDFAGGVLKGAALIGVLDHSKDSVVVERGQGSWTAGFHAVFALGVHHIADGTDHLLFLRVLLLPASLLARGGRWREPTSLSSSVRRIVGVVTAFTIGHSITLVMASLQVVTAPSQVVETIIALSILASAVHAITPLFVGREAVVAAVFGLVHGLAFATVLAELGVRGASLVLSLLAFNFGIECMQLVVVAVTMPWLVLLARTRLGRPVRVVVAVLAAVAAVAWAIERIFAVMTPVTVLVEQVAAQAPWLVALLAVTSLAATRRERRRRAGW